MKKYLSFFKTNVQQTLTYRGPILVWLVSNTLSVVIITAVWFSVEAGQTIGGYSKQELISYYLVGLFLQWLIGWYPFYGISREIKHGEIVLSTLIKPFSFWGRKFSEEIGWHVVSFWFGLGATLLLAFLFRSWVIVSFSLYKSLLLVITIGLAALTTFSFSLCMGLLAFWFTEVSAVDSLFWASRLILGGQAIPISFIPRAFEAMVKTLPFRYMFSFPLEIYFEKLSGPAIFQGIVVQCLWIGLLFLLYKVMWDRGRKSYTAFGH